MCGSEGRGVDNRCDASPTGEKKGIFGLASAAASTSRVRTYIESARPCENLPTDTSGEPRLREQVHARQVALRRFGNPFAGKIVSSGLKCRRARGLHTHRHYLAPKSLVQVRIHG